MATSTVDVLIAGGGAAGSMLLLELSRRGVHVRCVDQRLFERCLDRVLPSKGSVLHFVDEAGNRRSVRPCFDFTNPRRADGSEEHVHVRYLVA